jgi:hypothetical protein
MPHDMTYSGLCKWYKGAFEKVGWMILAKKSGGQEYKLKCFYDSLLRMKNAMKNKMEEIQDPDKKRDLKIMHDNLEKLIDYFGGMSGGARRRKSKMSKKIKKSKGSKRNKKRKAKRMTMINW